MGVDISHHLVNLRKEQKLSQEALADKLGLKRSTYANYEKGVSLPNYDILLAISKFYGVTVDSFFSDELFSSNTVNEPERPKYGNEATPIDLTKMHVMYVPLVSESAHAGYLRGYADPEYIESLEKIPWIVDREYKGNYLSFTISGDSMNDDSRNSYLSGDKVLCREVAKHLWTNNKLHIRDWEFIVVHRTEGIVLKQILEHDLARHKLKLHSFNPQYEDYEVDISDVLKVFNVVQLSRRKI